MAILSGASSASDRTSRSPRCDVLDAVSKAVAQAAFAHGPRGLGHVDGVDALAYVLCAGVAVVFGVLDLDIDRDGVDAGPAKTIAGNVDNVVTRLASVASVASVACAVGQALGIKLTRTPCNHGKNSDNFFHGVNRAPNWS